jgi:hypothetical protein
MLRSHAVFGTIALCLPISRRAAARLRAPRAGRSLSLFPVPGGSFGLDRVVESRLRWLSPQSPPWVDGEPNPASESRDAGDDWPSSSGGSQSNRDQSPAQKSKHDDIDLNEPAPGISDSERPVPPIPDINASFLP